jgi:MinD-like ATPase involved in chromosome partitioning or flagellar assembly
MTPLRIVTLAGDSEQEAALAGSLNSSSDVELVLRCVDRVELLAAIRSGGLDAIVSVGAPVWFDRQEADEAERAGIRVVGAVNWPPDADRLASLGASLIPLDAGVDDIIERCRSTELSPRRPLPSSQLSVPTGRLIAVWGPKGAPGRTTIAIELAAELALTDGSTLLIDGDPYGGDVLQLLGVAEELPTIVWAARMAAKDELDAARLALDLRRAGRAGPILLPGLPRAELWADISEYGWRQLLTVVRAAFRRTVCDTGFCLEPDVATHAGGTAGRNRMARETVRDADHVVAVCKADPVGVKNFLWSFEELRDLVEDDSIVVVANRVRAGDEKEVGELIKRYAGKRPVAYVPDRPQDVARAVMSGIPVRAGSHGAHISSAVRGLAAALGGNVPPKGVLTKLSART